MFKIIFLAVLATSALTFDNPVIPNDNNPDPGVIFYEGAYYAVTTFHGFPIHRSLDLQTWEDVGFVFPEGYLPSWGYQDFWAPELHIINGEFRVYYTAREIESGRLCIGVGSADNILGPYTDKGSPLIIQDDMGSIDATILYTEEEVKYLVFKDDGNDKQPKVETWFWAIELDDDGFGVHGDWYPLIKNDLDWEEDLVEGPWFIKRGDWYYLFYSASGYCGPNYAVGVARSRNALGPYEKNGDPIKVTDDQFAGPGHCSVVMGTESSYVMVYHAWLQGQVCGDNSRVMMADDVLWDEETMWPYFEGTKKQCWFKNMFGKAMNYFLA